MNDRRFVLLVLLAGAALRLALLFLQGQSLDGFYSAGEASRVALTLARTGSFADAYFVGQGPTAHLLPLNPAFAAAVFALFGTATAPANLILLAWSLGQSLAGFWLLRRVALRLGFDPVAARWGLALPCLLPVFLPQEVIDFRYWESGSAVVLAAANLLLMLRMDASYQVRWRRLALAAALAALTFFVSPIAGLAVDACWAWFALRRLPWQHWLGFAAMGASAMALLLVPWTIRNAAELGTPVLLRSNFGLELAIGNHAAAVSGTRPAETYAERLLAIHPDHSPAAQRVLQRLGEASYSRHLGTSTRHWVEAHPLAFLRLCARHLSQFFFPRPWQFIFTGWPELRLIRSLLVSTISLIGLYWLTRGLVQRRRGFDLLAIYVVVTALPYALVQPIPRYSYLVYGVLTFLAVEAVIVGLRYFRGKKEPGWAR